MANILRYFCIILPLVIFSTSSKSLPFDLLIAPNERLPIIHADIYFGLLTGYMMIYTRRHKNTAETLVVAQKNGKGVPTPPSSIYTSNSTLADYLRSVDVERVSGNLLFDSFSRSGTIISVQPPQLAKNCQWPYASPLLISLPGKPITPYFVVKRLTHPEVKTLDLTCEAGPGIVSVSLSYIQLGFVLKQNRDDLILFVPDWPAILRLNEASSKAKIVSGNFCFVNASVALDFHRAVAEGNISPVDAFKEITFTLDQACKIEDIP